MMSDESKVLLHSFFFSLVIFVDLSDDQLRILWTSSDVAPNTLANRRPVSRASYSASLLVVVYCRCTACLRTSPSSDFKITPTPPAVFVDSPSICIIHLDAFQYSSSLGSSSFTVNYAMKSAKA